MSELDDFLNEILGGQQPPSSDIPQEPTAPQQPQVENATISDEEALEIFREYEALQIEGSRMAAVTEEMERFVDEAGASEETSVEEEIEDYWEDEEENTEEETEEFPTPQTPVETSSDENTPDPAALPENSPSIMVKDTTSRFSGASWYDAIREQKVIIAGIGGIGSWTSFLIGRMGLQGMLLYDPDTIDSTNMSGQLFSRNNIGQFKVNAMNTLLMNYTDSSTIFGIHERFTNNTTPDKIMICGFDNMEARRTYYSKWVSNVLSLREEERKECLYIDGIIKCFNNNL